MSSRRDGSLRRLVDEGGREVSRSSLYVHVIVVSDIRQEKYGASIEIMVVDYGCQQCLAIRGALHQCLMAYLLL